MMTYLGFSLLRVKRVRSTKIEFPSNLRAALIDVGR